MLMLFDQKTHRPWMRRHAVQPVPRNPRNQATICRRRSRGPPEGHGRATLLRRSQTGRQRLARSHHIVKGSNGQMMEEWKIGKYKLKPRYQSPTDSKRRSNPQGHTRDYGTDGKDGTNGSLCSWISVCSVFSVCSVLSLQPHIALTTVKRKPTLFCPFCPFCLFCFLRQFSTPGRANTVLMNRNCAISA